MKHILVKHILIKQKTEPNEYDKHNDLTEFFKHDLKNSEYYVVGKSYALLLKVNILKRTWKFIKSLF